MAELILTDEEKATASWANLDDASLGRVVKRYITITEEVCRKDQARRKIGDGSKALFVTSAAILIGMEMDKENIGELDLRIERTVGAEETDNGTLVLNMRIERPAPSREGG